MSIPGNRINPIAQKIMALFPEPTGPGLPFTHASNFNKTYTQTIDDNRVDVRVDQNFGDKQRVYFSYAKDNRTYQESECLWQRLRSDQFHLSDGSRQRGGPGICTPFLPRGWLRRGSPTTTSSMAQQPGSLGYDITQLGFPSMSWPASRRRNFRG